MAYSHSKYDKEQTITKCIIYKYRPIPLNLDECMNDYNRRQIIPEALRDRLKST